MIKVTLKPNDFSISISQTKIGSCYQTDAAFNIYFKVAEDMFIYLGSTGGSSCQEPELYRTNDFGKGIMFREVHNLKLEVTGNV